MKKYDCSKTLDYMHERDRMHERYKEDCTKCPLHTVHLCGHIEGATTKSIEILQNWSDSHPEHTRADRFLELLAGTEFEELFRKDSGGIIIIHGCSGEEMLSGVWRVGTSYDADIEWWNEAVE